ncbi:MAG: hypothetical protein K1X57_07020 [Gemmataceae bacterium]|nr:hypothetical protein [Gemmataceae bacterium]
MRRYFHWSAERGVSYSLPFAMIIPFYLTFMAMTVEIAFLLQAKLGAMAAAQSAVRAAKVWQSAQPATLAEARIRQAAFTTLAAFVGGRQSEINAAGPIPSDAEAGADDYAAASNLALQSRAVDAEFLRRKYRHGAARTELQLEMPKSDPRGMITVTIKFRAPLYVPLASRFLDPDRRAPFEYPLTASATLPADGPVSRDGKLGIDYGSDLLERSRETSP